MIMETFSDPSAKEELLDFVDFSKLDERLKDRNTITMEFLSAQQQWRRARFIVSGRLPDGRVSRAMYLIEDIDEEKRERDKSLEAIKILNMRISSIANIYMTAHEVDIAGNTLLGLVNDILDFSKIEAGKMEIVPVDYDLSSMVNDLVNLIETRAREKDLAFVLDIDRNTPKLLHGDEVRIKQVITNILTNAVKYTEKGSVVFGITFRKEEEDPDSICLDISVKDTGIGIRQEDMEKLFSEFERIESDRNRHIEGTGLGSRFSFRLRQKVVKWEVLGDYEASYQNALNESRSYKEKFTAPDAEILVVDGPQILEMLKSEPELADIPVVFLTGVGTRESIERVMALKPSGYILKSTTREDLLKFLAGFFTK